MTTTNVNHSEIVKSMKPKIGELICKRDGYNRAWVNAMKMNDPMQEEFWQLWKQYNIQVETMKEELKFHEIMAQAKKYATCHLYTDAHAYEIIEEKSDKVIKVRQMKATIKPEAKVALRKSFVPGGFFGRTDNDLQEWICESDESNPIITIRKHKDGKWYSRWGSRFTIEAQPREFRDYNF
jgi:hypothetical protein